MTQYISISSPDRLVVPALIAAAGGRALDEVETIGVRSRR